MSGSFTRIDMEIICRGSFYSFPLIISAQDQGPGIAPKKRVVIYRRGITVRTRRQLTSSSIKKTSARASLCRTGWPKW
ncbi:hypothetical protein C8J57DRAFT_1279757 [Mycena rebaudengoi]|nr:hypothetical protein C8J57DRAFT_1298233 [Mycena rebaudengoi]KAJ7284415.1 hypothetical protein C8J57DRAFT_1288404 [Mycena rebaudengoi]KAJ7288286.1 hypothetical protein C8J57DRAFT_1279757 [Mycena rebaudengoi]